MGNPSEKIQVVFDPSMVRMSIELWRQATDLKMPVHDSLKVHFIQNRGRILKNFAKTAGAWSMIFHGIEAAAPEDVEALAAVRSEIDTFGEWAKSEIAKLDQMAEEESLRSGFDEAFLSPEIQNLLKNIGPKLPGEGA